MGLFQWLFRKKDKNETNKEDESIQETTTVKHTKKSPQYHVSLNKDDKSDHYKEWRVRQEKSQKTIKYFNTQKEAIAFAEDLAKKHNTSVVIHKLDGSIRKQDYSSN